MKERLKDKMRLEHILIGEAARMLSDDFKNAHQDVPWLSIANMRNFLVHEYFHVDNDTVWEVIHGDIVDLKTSIVRYLSEVDWKEWINNIVEP